MCSISPSKIGKSNLVDFPITPSTPTALDLIDKAAFLEDFFLEYIESELSLTGQEYKSVR